MGVPLTLRSPSRLYGVYACVAVTEVRLGLREWDRDAGPLIAFKPAEPGAEVGALVEDRASLSAMLDSVDPLVLDSYELLSASSFGVDALF